MACLPTSYGNKRKKANMYVNEEDTNIDASSFPDAASYLSYVQAQAEALPSVVSAVVSVPVSNPNSIVSVPNNDVQPDVQPDDTTTTLTTTKLPKQVLNNPSNPHFSAFPLHPSIPPSPSWRALSLQNFKTLQAYLNSLPYSKHSPPPGASQTTLPKMKDYCGWNSYLIPLPPPSRPPSFCPPQPAASGTCRPPPPTSARPSPSSSAWTR